MPKWLFCGIAISAFSRSEPPLERDRNEWSQQGLGRPAQVAAAAVLQRQAHQVDQARTGLLQLRAQIFAAEVARDLHHALGRIRADGVQPGGC
jgi:hypothetical protein